MKKNLDRVHKLVNASVTSGQVPTAWKLGRLIPIPKAGKDPGFVESYRLVCLLPCLGKLVDRIVTTRLDFIAEQKGILPHSQAGFRRGRTTEDPLLDLMSDIHDLRAHRQRVDKCPIALLLLDLEKAFERVDPRILLRTTHRLGIPPYLIKWYHSFLIDRRYRVKYGSAVSKIARFALGVPQGSISGSLLFTIYLSTLTKKISSLNKPTINHGEYVVDLSIWARVRKKTDGSYNMKPLQRTLDVISRWSSSYGINATKSAGVLFSKDHRSWYGPHLP